MTFAFMAGSYPPPTDSGGLLETNDLMSDEAKRSADRVRGAPGCRWRTWTREANATRTNHAARHRTPTLAGGVQRRLRWLQGAPAGHGCRRRFELRVRRGRRMVGVLRAEHRDQHLRRFYAQHCVTSCDANDSIGMGQQASAFTWDGPAAAAPSRDARPPTGHRLGRSSRGTGLRDGGQRRARRLSVVARRVSGLHRCPDLR
jgi:hypothetical protein